MKLLCLSLVVGMLTGCSGTSTKSPAVVEGISQSLDHPRWADVSVKQDRDKGVVTLGGYVAIDEDKAEAESIATSLAGGQVVANQIVVRPKGLEREAAAVASDLDQGIEHNLNAALIQNDIHDGVSYGVKTGVVTLTGAVNSQTLRAQTERVASAVPNVQQVVNELQVKNQKATSR
jgi:osmotically-inducible protein OsmY